MFWTLRGKRSEQANDLIRLRRASVIKIEDADSFFQSLLEKLVALEEFEQPHPLSVAAAVATAERYLAEPRHTIRLSNLVRDETEKLYAELDSLDFDMSAPFTGDDLRSRLRRYEVLRSFYWQ